MACIISPPSQSSELCDVQSDCGNIEVDFVAPRAGLEPATKRLTAAHSTIELPGNKNLGATTRVCRVDSGIFWDFPQDISLDPCLESRRHGPQLLR
jgi:hypothetical protein